MGVGGSGGSLWSAKWISSETLEGSKRPETGSG